MGWMCVCGCVGERTEAERRSGDSNRVSGYTHESVKSLPRIDADAPQLIMHHTKRTVVH
jgi:hypothetical protein